MGRPSRFSPEVRERAVRMVEEHREAHASAWAVLQSVAPKLGCTAETRRKWVRQAQRDAGHRPGLTTSERERLKELEREVRELKRANEILRKAFAYVAQAELDRRRTSPRGSSSSPTIAPWSGSSRSAPCCRSPRRRTHRHRHQRTHPPRRSARAQRDDQLRVEIQRVSDAHQQVYGPRTVWTQLRRDGVRVARCTVARLMRAMGLAGAGPGSPRPTQVRAVARWTSLTADSWPPVRISSGSPISRTSQPGAAVSTSRSSSTCLRDALWAGGCRPPCARTLCWMRWSRRSTPAGATPSPASYITVMPGRNISRCGTRIASWTPASRRRSAAKAMPMTVSMMVLLSEQV